MGRLNHAVPSWAQVVPCGGSYLAWKLDRSHGLEAHQSPCTMSFFFLPILPLSFPSQQPPPLPRPAASAPPCCPPTNHRRPLRTVLPNPAALLLTPALNHCPPGCPTPPGRRCYRATSPPSSANPPLPPGFHRRRPPPSLRSVAIGAPEPQNPNPNSNYRRPRPLPLP